ncbi:dnaA protein [Tistlia consotensis]|uniref:DnaA protein n=1 Tax=Tistlia consotensis USBA 355 TaxID=560819 RepID=A0A1Y6CQW6_9PROT|nr:DnaA/Hda family protein [Tistlia consotensis]SMF83271.1 dnaA protein [Tistlia consotensis USBA 355]SNS32361.1 dnaA protein [Tistlia consotensis]
MTAPAQLVLTLPQRPALGRADFLVAPCNETAVAWIDRWPDWPATALALAGPAGSGKSHLAEVWRGVSSAPSFSVAELEAEGPAGRLGAARAALLDDAAAVAGRPAAEEALLHLYNLLAERRGTLLLAAEAEPARWPVGLADLASRLATATVARLGPPDDALMKGLLIKLFSDRQLRPAAEAVDYLVARMERTYAAAQRLVEAIDRRALAERRRVTKPVARAVLDALGEAGESER